MENNSLNDLTEKEKKIYKALFEKEENEYSKSIEFINKTFSKKITDQREFPDFQSLMSKEEGKEKIIPLRKNFMNKKITIFLAAAALLFVAVFVAFNQSSKNSDVVNAEIINSGKVVFVSGEVSLKSSTGQELPKPIVGSAIGINDVLITANKSMIDILMSNGTTVKVKSNSEFSIKKMKIEKGKSEEELFLKRGVIVADVKKRKQNDDFTVTTPTVIAGVRGTKFQVEVNPKKGAAETTKVSVVEGSVGITKRDSSGVPLSAEPIEILSADEQAIEKGFGQDIYKKSKTPNEIEDILAFANDADSESDLTGFHGRSEIEKLTLEDKSIVRGVVIEMDENYFTVHTLQGVIKIERSKVISSDTEKVK